MEFNYQKKRKHTIGKLCVMSASTLLPIAAYFILSIIYEFFGSDNSLDLEVLRLMVVVVFELIIAFKIVHYIRIIISEDYATDYFIKKYDERNLYIKQRTTSFTLKLTLYIIAVALIVSGFFSKLLFYTLGGLIVVIAIVYFATLTYFSKRY